MKKILIWDWDGTLIDSLDYKYVGVWQEVFPGDEIKQKAIIEFIQTPEGKLVNRYGLICHALAVTGTSDIVGLDDDNLKSHPCVRLAAERYAQATTLHNYSNGLCEGVESMLANLYNKGYHMYVISGGGTDNDLQEMLKNLKIDKYFKRIFGFGNPGAPFVHFGKHQNFVRVMEVEEDNNVSNYVIVGDEFTDYEFAEKVGCQFVAVKSKWNQWNNVAGDFPVIENVREISKFI